jgi:hypothetical protein
MDTDEKDLNLRINEVQVTADAALAIWEEKQASVMAESEAVIDSYNSSIASLQANFTQAQRNFNGALNNAKLAVQATGYQCVVQTSDARFAVDIARHVMSGRILEATRNEEDVSKEMFRVYGDASRDVEIARQKAHALQAEIDDLVRELDALEQSSSDDLWTESRTTHLRNDLADVRSRKEIAKRVVSAAAAMTRSDDYANKKANADAAHQALVETEQVESAMWKRL